MLAETATREQVMNVQTMVNKLMGVTPNKHEVRKMLQGLLTQELASMGECSPLDRASEELRTAAIELGRITGRIDVEELLDVIFRDFCIGK